MLILEALQDLVLTKDHNLSAFIFRVVKPILAQNPQHFKQFVALVTSIHNKSHNEINSFITEFWSTQKIPQLDLLSLYDSETPQDDFFCDLV